ncbi:MAG: hypothetical protein LC768_07650 [Acidobacteria bacterium]|nr:hypothetical protein [Acidobacteriota bacterium]
MFPYEATTTDFRTVIQASGLNNNEGHVVVAVGSGRGLGLLIKSIREQGYSGPIFANIGYVATGSRAVLGEDRSGIIYTDLQWRNNEATTWMTEQYRTRFSKEAPASAVIEFQTVLLLAMAAQEARSQTADEVARAVTNLSPSVIGVAPTDSNDILPVVVLRRENGNAN